MRNAWRWPVPASRSGQLGIDRRRSATAPVGNLSGTVSRSPTRSPMSSSIPGLWPITIAEPTHAGILRMRTRSSCAAAP